MFNLGLCFTSCPLRNKINPREHRKSRACLLKNDTSVTAHGVESGVGTPKAMSFHKEHAFMLAEVPIVARDEHK